MPRWKRFTRIGLAIAALAAVITLVTERQALAQAVRAALVRNQDEPGRNPYSQFAECLGTECSLTFPPVPAGQRLVVTFVSIVAGDANGGPLAFTGHGQDVRFFTTQNASVSIYNGPTVAYYEAGETPTLNCYCGNSLMEATLSGYFISLP
ncbi:MAG TPA: hypothetical protein VKT81_11250 [Bryobacteraceae bacterium]|nr:hypothetical protein [Bryobacteraceae bacterium]